MERNTIIYPYVSDRLRNDPKIFNMLGRVSISDMNITGLVPRDDRRSAIKAVIGDHMNYGSLSPRMRSDKHIALLFLHLYPQRVRTLEEHLLNDIDILMAYMRRSPRNISIFPQHLRSMWRVL